MAFPFFYLIYYRIKFETLKLLTKKLKTIKTAKILIKGDVKSDKIKRVWICLHGYGQLAEIFIRNFSFLNEEENIVIVPEALNRFYLNGFSGKVGASWMTKEEREDEIEDQKIYLDNIIQLIKEDKYFSSAEKNVLGFSQGTATAIRWILRSEFIPNNLILWGGTITNHYDLNGIKDISNKTRLTICIGDDDEFISEDKISESKNLLDENEIKHQFILYEGNHKIYKDVLEKIYCEG